MPDCTKSTIDRAAGVGPDDAALGASQLRLAPQLFIGLMVTMIGVLFVLENLGIGRWSVSVLRYWPAGLIAIGLAKLRQSRDGMAGSLGGLVFTFVGTWLLLERAARERISFQDLSPLLLLFLGGYLVWQGAATSRPRSP
jgi:hypothetical protein